MMPTIVKRCPHQTINRVSSSASDGYQRTIPKRKSNGFLHFECLGQFDSHQPLFKHQFSNYCNSIVPDFKNLQNLIHLNDISDTNTIFDDTLKTLNVVRLHVQGNEAEMCDG